MEKNKQLVSVLVAIIILQSIAILYLLLREREVIVVEPPISQEESEKEEVVVEATPEEIDGIPPPELTEDMPERFETNAAGEFKITWKDVEGAKRYRVYLFDKKGKEVKTASTKGNVLYVQKIPYTAGDQPYAIYKVSMVSIDSEGKEGPHGRSRPLKIYRSHSDFIKSPAVGEKLEAPKIKSIVTED